MRTKIYVLIDPRDKGVRYVGKTKRSLEARLGAHCSEARIKTGTHKIHWIRELLGLKLKPLIEQIKEVEGDWSLEEIEVIRELRESGIELTNASIGGSAPMLGRRHSPETILKMKARRNNYSKEESAVRSKRFRSLKANPNFETKRLQGLANRDATWLKNVSEACRKTVQKRKQQRFFKLLTSSIKARF